jgi:ATP-binding cassette subfamily C protein LapB
VPIFAVPVVLLISFALQFPLRKAVEQSFRASAQKHGVLVEALAAIENIKTLQAEGVLQRRWEQLLGEIAKSSLRSRLISALAVNLTLLVQQVATIAIVIFGVYLIKAGELSTGALIASTILTGRALAPLGQVAGLMMRYHQSRAALKALNHIMSLPLERPEGQDFVHRPELQGAVEFKNVQFQYPTQPLKTLQNISFKIQAGERVGIIGRVASGKSSLAKLLLNLYQVGEGSVLLDGIDSRQLDPADLRRNIGYVPQDSVLFYGTVKENIVMGAPYLDDAALVQAAHLAGVDEFVNQHPLGFDLPIGERGEGLSGGQRQAIALARALLHNPPILLMDEPSNAMDNSSEEQFKTRLLPYLEGKTLLLITHRTSLLSLVDRLIVVDNGQIVADGPKDAVIQALSSGRVARSSQ